MKNVFAAIMSALAFAPSLAAANLPISSTVEAEQAARVAETCVTMMSGFPNDDPESRYLFFRLSQALAHDMTPELSALMAEHMAENETRRLPSDWPIMDVIEDIADPVLRQAAPVQTIASMAHIIHFDALCGDVVSGQVDALAAFDPSLAEADLYIREDALYLRQILAEALERVSDKDSPVLQAYAASLVRERDDIEFDGFEAEVDELEALYMGDLDERLETSNDLINAEAQTGMDDAFSLSRDMNEQARRQARQQRTYSLVRILGGAL